MINHQFVGPLGVLRLRPDTLCYAIVAQHRATATTGPVCLQPLRAHALSVQSAAVVANVDWDTPSPPEKSLTEEELQGFWRRACVIADQQISYPAANILTEFVSLIQDNGRSTP